MLFIAHDVCLDVVSRVVSQTTLAVHTARGGENNNALGPMAATI